MRIVVVCMARNEADVIELFVRWQLRYADHRPESERTSHHKLLVPGPLLRRRGVRLSSGNHRVLRRTLGGRAKVPSVETDALWLAHFPLRSVEQLRAKVWVGWLARLASAEQHIDTRKNLHLEKMFERLRDGGELGPEELAGFTRFYMLPEGEGESPKLVHAPIAPPGGPIELRYTAPERAGSLPALLDFAQRLAAQTGAARARAVLAPASDLRPVARLTTAP